MWTDDRRKGCPISWRPDATVDGNAYPNRTLQQMTGPPTVLDSSLLAVLEERLGTQGVLVDEWEPGLSDDEMSETLAPLGLTMPAEGRALWGWHNGAPGQDMGNQLGPVGPEFLDLAAAVKCHQAYRRVVLKTMGHFESPPLDDPDFSWSPAWLPFIGWQLPAVLDCSVPNGSPSPVRVIAMEDPIGSSEPVADSLAEVVKRWINALDRGAWEWHLDRSEWSRHLELLDPESRKGRLI
jgi:cell wall assembly regulator SMI1